MRHRHAGLAVDRGMMHLAVEADAAVGEALEAFGVALKSGAEAADGVVRASTKKKAGKSKKRSAR